MSSDELAMIAAIRADRDSDVPRLVYADWLEENGRSERAEFIRVQCWLSANPATHPEWELMWAREQQLIHNPLAKVTLDVNHEVMLSNYYDRGFPLAVRFRDAEQFQKHSEFVVSNLATDHFHFDLVFDDTLSLIYSHPLAAEIRGLWFEPDSSFTRDSFQELCETPELQQLRSFCVGRIIDGNQHLDEYVWLLLSSFELLPDLRLFDSGTTYPFPSSMIVRLLESPFRSKLEGLRLSYFNGGGQEFCESSAIRRLRFLILDNPHVSNITAQYLLDSPYLDKIELLTYPCNLAFDPVSYLMIDHLRQRYGERIDFDPSTSGSGAWEDRHVYRAITGRPVAHFVRTDPQANRAIVRSES